MSAATNKMRALADRFIPKPIGSFDVTKVGGSTADIIDNVLIGYKRGRHQLVKFARECQKAGLLTPYNLWDFTRNEIQYRLDPDNWQWIKSPDAVWDSGFADCKSKSIFIASVLTACNIPFAFRFTSYGESRVYTHVYIVVSYKGEIIPIDAVYTEFGREKQFTFHKDYPMKIAQIGALPEKRIPTHGGKLSTPASGKLTHKLIPEAVDLFKLSEGELSAYLHLQRLKLKQSHAQAIKGIGSVADENLQDQIDLTQDIIQHYDDPRALEVIADHAAEGKYNVARQVAGIGSAASRQAKRAERQADRNKRLQTNTTTGASKSGDKPKGIRKVITAIKKAGAVAIKAATLVPRTIIKGILELELPKAAPNFLYLFVNDPALIAKLPDAARRKRKKQEEIFLFITQAIGMKSEHVMGILRNGIIERTGKEPEQLIAAQLGGQIAGIGVIEDAFEILVKIIKKIAELIKKKAPSLAKGDVADVAADFPAAGSPEARQLATEVEAQKADTVPVDESDTSETPSSGRTARKGFC